ncbi:hypothetical protein [Phorcysia thermohydrogeniphila]|uniref:Carboxypeptidase family protein n=1 Tax=Phorcysia thermohydrogeniphila TaxID=936138 RepID=A0A4R1GE55_9BACT|nr:hypothetical protein [Phorcysia thermohydrogeniphila]TCK04019.1 hypothetical protein CLV27_1336 [Phorcysia thermohydrogeniphila]
MKIRKLLLFSTIASLYLASCGGGSDSTSSYTLRGAVLASKVKGVKVCEAGTTNCSVTDENGYYTLTVHSLPVKLELKVGKVVLGDVEVASTQVEEAVITPLDLAEGDPDVAEKVGAFIHALAGDVEGDDVVVDLSNVDIEEEVDVEKKIEEGEEIRLNLGEYEISVHQNGVEVVTQQGVQVVNYDVTQVENEENEVCQELSQQEESEGTEQVSQGETVTSEQAQSEETQTSEQQETAPETGTGETQTTETQTSGEQTTTDQAQTTETQTSGEQTTTDQTQTTETQTSGEQTTTDQTQTDQTQTTETQTSQEPRTVTIRGLAYDSEVDSGVAHLYKVNPDGTLVEVTQTEFTGGEFSFEITEGDIESDAKYIVKVEGQIGGKEVKFVSTLGSGETIISKVQENNGEVSQEDIPELVVSNVSTADYLLLKSEYGSLSEINTEDLEKLLAQVKALKLDERLNVAAAIKAYVDKGAELKEGISDLAGLVREVIKHVNDDGQLTTSELKEIFASEDDIGKFGEAIVEVKGDENLKKVLVESAVAPEDEEVINAIEGKTFYFKEDEYAPVYQTITFEEDEDGDGKGEIETHAYVYTEGESGGQWIEENDVSKIPLYLKRWEVSGGKLYVYSDANIKYLFNVLSMDEDKIVGIATAEDDSNINWLSDKYAFIYGDTSTTYQSLEDFVSHFTNCDVAQIIQAYMSGNFETAQQLEGNCFLGAFKFDTQNHQVIFSMPTFDQFGNLTGSRDLVFGSYEINGNEMKITFTPVKYDDVEYQIFPPNFQPVIYVRLVDQQLAEEAQSQEASLYTMRALRQEELTTDGTVEGVPPELQDTGDVSTDGTTGELPPELQDAGDITTGDVPTDGTLEEPPPELQDTGDIPTDGTVEEPPSELQDTTGELPTEGTTGELSQDEGTATSSELEGEGAEGVTFPVSEATPQVGNVIVLFAADNLKMTLYTRVDFVQSFVSDPFAIYGMQPPEGETINMTDSFEKFVCEEYIEDERVTLQDVDNPDNQATLWCENDELKISFNGGDAVDFNEDTGKLSACPIFGEGSECTIVDATEVGFTVCKLENNQPSECKFFTNTEKMDEFLDDLE